MAVTIAQLTTYIIDYRTGNKNIDYATKNSTKLAQDAVKSALIWASGAFYKSERTTGADWEDFETALFTNSSSGDLSDYTLLKAHLSVEQLIIFEAVCDYAIYKIYAITESEQAGADKKASAINMLAKIVGMQAADIEQAGTEKGFNSEPCISTSNVDETAIETITGTYFKVY